MQMFGLVALMVSVTIGVLYFAGTDGSHFAATSDETETMIVDESVLAAIIAKQDEIVITMPSLGGMISNPIEITGEARGNWFFEGSFPVTLSDWQGRVLAESYVTAQQDAMTTDFVPFTAVINFTNPYQVGDAKKNRYATLVFKKANPSGLEKYNDSLELPIALIASVGGKRDVSSYEDALDAAQEVSDLFEAQQQQLRTY